MANFKNFVNGGPDVDHSTESTSIRYRQTRDNRVGSRIEKVWATDFERCKNREDFEKYISKYGKYDANKYVEQARARIESFDAAENARIEREKAAQRVQQRPIAPVTGGSGITPKNNFIQNLMKVAIWIVIIGGVGLYSYNQYQKEDNTTDVVVTPTPVQHHESQEEYPSQTHSELTNQQEISVIEPEPEPQEVWWDCNICGATGRCQLCFGSGRCAVCGGTGSQYLFGEWTNCGNCGGSGRCPSCDGSGACFACHGSGRCKLEE